MSSGIAIKGTTLRESLHTVGIHLEVALLESATTHTILRDPLFFSFIGSQIEAWQVCKMHTIAGGCNFKFREGRAIIALLGDVTLLVEQAMYASTAHRSLINFKDLTACGIHTFTMLKNNKEVLELRQGIEVLAITYVETSGLYELPIINGVHPHNGIKTSLVNNLSQL